MKQIEVEVKNFKLYYDGVYQIIFSDGKQIFAYLPLNVILRMLKIEELSNEDVDSIMSSWQGYGDNQELEFQKVTLVYTADIVEEGDQEDEVGTIYYHICEQADAHSLEHDLSICEFRIKE
jgi:hypothetical protein